MAEALLNKLVAVRVRATSAGTEPVEAIEPMVTQVMREVNIDIRHQRPKKLTIEMIEQAERVITMGYSVEEVCPATFIETEDWALDDPRGQPLLKIREIRGQVQAKVQELLVEIS